MGAGSRHHGLLGSGITLPLAVAGGVEQAAVRLGDLDTQAFSPAGADVDGAQLAALDTLQHRLPRDTQRHGGLQHRQPAFGGLLDEPAAQLVGDADPPGGTWGGLLAGDEPIGQPPVHRGGRHAQQLGRAGDGDQLALWWGGGWLVAADTPVVAQALHDRGGEAQAAGAAAALAVEDPGDDGIGVVGRQPADQRDGVLVGADRRGVGAGQLDDQLAGVAAAPAQQQPGAGGVAVDGDDDLLEQGAQQLLAVPVGGGRRLPHQAHVAAQGGDGGPLGGGQRLGAALLAAGQLGLGRRDLGELGLPVALQPAGDQAVVGVDGQVAPLGQPGLVVGALDFQAPLPERGVVVGLQPLGGGHRGLDAGGGERRAERLGDGLVDLPAADAQAVDPAAVDQVAAGAVVAGPGVAAAVVHRQLAAALAAHRDALQQRRALADRAAGLVGLGADVLADAVLVGLVAGPVDEPGMMVGDEDLPVGLGQAPGAAAHLPFLGDVALVAGPAIHVGASIGRVGDDVVDRLVGRHDLADLAGPAEGGGLQWEPQALVAEPQPGRADAAELGEPLQHRADRAADLLVGVEADLAGGLAPHQPDRQRATQFPSGGLAADPALQAGAEGVQLGLAHGALEAQHQPVVERAGVIQPVAVADQGVGQGAQVQQPIPVGVVAGQAGDLKTQHQPDVAEGDLGGQPGEPRPLGGA